MNPLESKLEQVRADTQRVLAEFVKTELRSGLTFAALAKTEYSIGDEEGGDRAGELAAKAYAVALSHMGQIEWAETDQQWVEDRCRELHNALDGLQRP